jgi:AcrR family transcriptional regulator
MVSIYGTVGFVSSDDDPLSAPIPTRDGRRARRERGRLAAIDATFELILEGKYRPSAEEIAERAGVSVASVFRYFDGTADARQHALDRFVERFMPLLEVADDVAVGSRHERIATLVRSRLGFYERAGALLAAGRAHLHDGVSFVEARDRMRSARADQVRAYFAPELAGATPARAADLVSTVDSLTSPETWDVLREHHGRSRGQIRASWIRNVSAVVAAWEAT